MINVIATERTMKDDRTGFQVVNEKTDEEKFSDFKLGMKFSDEGEVELSFDEVSRILKLAHHLETEIYGALKFALLEKMDPKDAAKIEPEKKIKK